jgi:hypothetical protein
MVIFISLIYSRVLESVQINKHTCNRQKKRDSCKSDCFPDPNYKSSPELALAADLSILDTISLEQMKKHNYFIPPIGIGLHKIA